MRTMATLLFALAVGFSPAEAQTTYPRCNVGADPVNINRQPTADEEVVINPADKVITYKSGNGRNVTCTLQAGVPVVINKTTGVAVWVFGCGNDIVPPSWTPKKIQGLMGPQGPQGPMGPAGPRGPQGLDGMDFTPPSSDGSWCGTTCHWLLGGAAILGIGVAVGEHNNWWRGDHKGLEVTTDDVTVICTGFPCPGAPTVGGNKWGSIKFAFPIR